MLLGDAVFNFTADTTQLDEAFQKVQSQAESALAPAAEAAQGLSDAVEQVGTSATVAAEAMAKAGSASEQAATQASSAWQRVAQATSANIQAQNDLRAAMSAVRKTGGESESALQLLAKAQEQAAKTALDLAAAQKAVVTGAREEAVAVKEADEAFNMGEAKATIALLGDEVGVKIPRHLRGFVAQLPGVGEALNAAFEFTAGLILVQILVEAGKKVYEFYDALNVLGASEAAHAEQARKDAKDQLEFDTKRLQAEYAILIAKAEGKEQDRLRLEEATALVGLNKQYVDNLQQQINYVKNLKDAEEERAKASSKAAIEASQHPMDMGGGAAAGLALESTISEKRVENAKKTVDDLQKTYDEATFALQNAQAKQIEDQKTFNNGTQQNYDSDLSALKRVTDAKYQLTVATNRLLTAEGKMTAGEEVIANQQAWEQKYQDDKSALEKRATLLAKDPSKNKNAIKQVNAEIEALENEHEAKSLASYANFLNLLKAARAQALAGLQRTDMEKLYPDPLGVKKVQDAFTALGITSSYALTQTRVAAQAAAQVIDGSTVSSVDKLRAHLALLQAQLAEAKEYGLPWKSLQQDIDKTTKEIDKATGATQKFGKQQHTTLQDVEKFNQGLREQRGELTQNQQKFDGAIGGISDAFGQAVEDWMKGQKSFGQALKEAVGEYLASVAAKSAADALYWTAWGIADSFWNPARAATDFAAAATFAGIALLYGGAAMAMRPSSTDSASSSAASSGPTPSGSSVQPSGQPSQISNVPRFAAGALISSPTLAMIGDGRNGGSGREAVLPLDDRRAMSAIRDSLGGAGETHHHYHHVNVEVEGMISPDNLTEVIHQITNQVEHKNVRLAASHARRVTKI